ncbi:ABC transporter permease [Streptomyces blattellae]|uniref:ABC transporter permease n=1 Tax=Streptomyces blattellae TaxID=2569855 RepID=UPI0012B986C9|nr:FtsX-like permease family protein [Streptomyces blattellae]
MNVRHWTRDLGMGVRFAFAGGREGWVRVLLTGVGVGLGVALLLLTTALPNALNARSGREAARSDINYGSEEIPKGDDTLLLAASGTTFRDKDIRGRDVQPEGPKAPLPPGVEKLPAVGEMVVSPALEKLLGSDEGKLLRERLPQQIVGTIGDSGLIGPAELTFYRGGEGLAAQLDSGGVVRIEKFGNQDSSSDPLDPVLLLLILVVFVVLLMPVGVFIAAAVRFGGERRDRRLAALRLVGSDSRMTKRVAAGEALAGAALGLLFGTGFFLLGREIAGSLELFDVSVFPSYLNPSPALALLVAVVVPAAGVVVTLFALRRVVIEPLGVVRTAKPARRRLWWRLLLPLAGLAMLYPMFGQGRDDGDFNQYLVVGGVMLLLVGVTVLLPWIVETVVARLGSGGIAWQLAVRRLQLSSGTAARMVNGIAVAVAGAIALQMLFTGIDDDYTRPTGKDVTRAQMQVNVPDGVPLAQSAAKFRDTDGVRGVYAYDEAYVSEKPMDAELSSQVTVGDCAALREVTRLPSCRDGDVFAVQGAEDDANTETLAKPGGTVYFDSGYTDGPETTPLAWTLPPTVKKAQARVDMTGWKRGGLMVTPKALPAGTVPGMNGQIYLSLDESVPDVRDLVRNTAATIDPVNEPMTWSSTARSERYDSIRTGLFVGAACVLALIGASLLVSQLEQLRERKKLLSSLVAFGTRRRTLSLSVLWQTAIPVAIGLLLASVVGLTLGAVLLRMSDAPITVDWASVATMAGSGAAVVLAVTLLSLPPLLRLMRPDGLRTE